MNKHTIVAISGKQGSGKTTLAKSLVEKYKGSHFKFADPLYDMHNSIRDLLFTKYNYSMKVKDGKLLQLLGTEWGRNTLGETIWSDLTSRRIMSKIHDCDTYENKAFIVIDDTRFENELDMFSYFKEVSNCHVITIRLEAGEEVRKVRADDWRPATEHPSEVGLDHRIKDFDLVLDTSILGAKSIFSFVCAHIEGKK